MKRFMVVVLLSGLMMHSLHARKKDEVVKPQVEAVEAAPTTVLTKTDKVTSEILLESGARGDGFVTALLSTSFAGLIGAGIAGSKGAFALAGLSVAANMVSSFKNCAKSQTLKRNDPEAPQSPSEQYDTAFADAQGLTAIAMGAAAYLGFIVYDFGYRDGYICGLGAAVQKPVSYVMSSYPDWCLC